MGSDSRQPAARIGDIDTGHPPAPPTPVITGSTNVFINSRPAARKGDMLAPHHPGIRLISEGSASVLINGKPAARITDSINCGGKLITGSFDVLIGNQPGGARNTIPRLELSEYLRESLKPENIGLTPREEVQLAADVAVKYRGPEGAIATWHDYFMSNELEPGDILDPAKAEGYRRARVEKGLEVVRPTSRTFAFDPNLPFGENQQKKIGEALVGQQRLLEIKKEELSKWDKKGQENFKRSFGTTDDAARSLIGTRIDKMLKLNQSMTLKNFMPAAPENNKEGLFAYVYPTDENHTIYLGDQFWKSSSSGTDSTAGTLAHEMSHFIDIGGTKDGFPKPAIYGVTSSRKLAETNSELALKHADSFQYYLEDAE